MVRTINQQGPGPSSTRLALQRFVRDWPDWPEAEAAMREHGCSLDTVQEVRAVVSMVADFGWAVSQNERVLSEAMALINISYCQGAPWLDPSNDPAHWAYRAPDILVPGFFKLRLSVDPPDAIQDPSKKYQVMQEGWVYFNPFIHEAIWRLGDGQEEGTPDGPEGV